MTKAYDDEPRRGPLALAPIADAYEVRGSVIPPSGPADPRQRVRNDRRTPEPYSDLVVLPDLTGTYFEKDGRYRLFINHAGGHLECLFTLVVKDSLYHHPILPPKGRGKKPPRLSADVLSVPAGKRGNLRASVTSAWVPGSGLSREIDPVAA